MVPCLVHCVFQQNKVQGGLQHYRCLSSWSRNISTFLVVLLLNYAVFLKLVSWNPGFEWCLFVLTKWLVCTYSDFFDYLITKYGSNVSICVSLFMADFHNTMIKEVIFKCKCHLLATQRLKDASAGHSHYSRPSNIGVASFQYSYEHLDFNFEY